MLVVSQCGCVINAIDCTYSKLLPEDEELIYSKHVEDTYWNKLRKKLHLVGSYYANNCHNFKIENSLLKIAYAFANSEV